MIWLWLLILALAVCVLAMAGKIYLLRCAAREIEAALGERLAADTNTLIDISSRDGAMRSLAAALNVQLRRLRLERQRFQQGDRELKEAVTNVSHDLRTPLTAIFGYLELLRREPLTENAARYVGMIDSRAQAMRRLTEELLRYSVLLSAPALTPEPVELGAALEESLASSYGALTQAGVTPEITLPAEKVRRRLDRSALARIFGNILGNAVKYSDGDLTVTLEASGRIVFSNAARGLSSVEAARLFDRFYTVETGRGATGLGLAIAKLLTERMGGEISAEYREGRLSVILIFPNTVSNNVQFWKESSTKM